MKNLKQNTAFLTWAQALKIIKYLPFNRVSEAKQPLIESLNKYGMLSAITIIKTNLFGTVEYFILDGQHRLKSAIFNKMMKIHYIICEKPIDSIPALVNLVSTLNTTSKKWSINDYVDAYRYLNYSNYIKLSQFVSQHPYSLSTCASLLAGRTSNTGNVGVRKSLQTGEYMITHLENTTEIMNLARLVSKYMLPTSRMLFAFRHIMMKDNYNQLKFINQYRNNIEAVRELKLDDYRAIFASWL